uniref:Uncharacterized protein n=1 Tax=Picea glauca TaxID=3330 RepID=A0A117NIJ3_PICGL|nr:hypothetical protein ABT39_MTgene3246 [Picea glauca]QHR89254.1 hypothetical protein Q903MT_gene3274 [Picea sitchensis]
MEMDLRKDSRVMSYWYTNAWVKPSTWLKPKSSLFRLGRGIASIFWREIGGIQWGADNLRLGCFDVGGPDLECLVDPISAS